MVVRVGDSFKNHSLGSLIQDMRTVMSPHTAARLKERKSNKLKDFIVMAGPLGVSHLLIFNQSKEGNINLRMARTPHGPTLHFKVKNYSLCKDVRKFVKNPKSVSLSSAEFKAPPLLALEGFETDTPEKILLKDMFKHLMPPISVQSIDINSVQRVLLIFKDEKTGRIDLRHYAIDTQLAEVSKPIKKLINAKEKNKRLPNLSKVKDVADMILDPYANGAGYTSESEVEEDAVIHVQQEDDVSTKSIRNTQDVKVKSEDEENVLATAPSIKKNIQKRTVKLTELGPRLELELIKIEEGICDGKIMYHSYIKRTEEEEKKLEKKHALKQRQKQARRKEQEENVKRKNAVKDAKKERRKLRKDQQKEDPEENDDHSDGENPSASEDSEDDKENNEVEESIDEDEDEDEDVEMSSVSGSGEEN